MYLKIRNSNDGAWDYISDFHRLKVFDPETVTLPVSANCTAHELERAFIGTVTYAKSLRFSVLDPKYLEQDSRETCRLRFYLAWCQTKSPDGVDLDYVVAFNTVAFLCSERGHTMDRFILNRE